MKTRNRISILTQISNGYTFWIQHFGDLGANAKEISIFQNPFNYNWALPNLQLEVNNVLCNDLLKCRGHRKNPVVYKCLPSEYAQLKSCSRIDTSIWQYVSVWKDIFKDEMCKISLQITIHRWSLTIDFNDRKH